MTKQKLLAVITAATLMTAGVSVAHAAAPIAATSTSKPTIVLIHGAFADSASWNGVAQKLKAQGYPVLAVANPLRSVKGDSDYAAKLINAVKGPVVLVGHSYGGMVISNAAEGNKEVKALVYVAAFAPDQGETVAGLAGKFPGGTLGEALADPVDLPNGGKDLYIQQDKFRSQFAADVPAKQAELMAIGQRPVTGAALNEPSNGTAWKNIPSYFVYGTGDKNIPLQALHFMAERAYAKDIVEVRGASHVVMVSHPDVVVKLIQKAAQNN